MKLLCQRLLLHYLVLYVLYAYLAGYQTFEFFVILKYKIMQENLSIVTVSYTHLNYEETVFNI